MSYSLCRPMLPSIVCKWYNMPTTASRRLEQRFSFQGGFFGKVFLLVSSDSRPMPHVFPANLRPCRERRPRPSLCPNNDHPPVHRCRLKLTPEQRSLCATIVIQEWRPFAIACSIDILSQPLVGDINAAEYALFLSQTFTISSRVSGVSVFPSSSQ